MPPSVFNIAALFSSGENDPRLDVLDRTPLYMLVEPHLASFFLEVRAAL